MNLMVHFCDSNDTSGHEIVDKRVDIRELEAGNKLHYHEDNGETWSDGGSNGCEHSRMFSTETCHNFGSWRRN